MLGMDDRQKGSHLREKRKTSLPVIPSPRVPDLYLSRWRRCYKSRGFFPLYFASEVQKQSNVPVTGQKLATKVNKSRVPKCGRHFVKFDDVTIYPVLVVARTGAMPPYVPGVNPSEWPLISA